ncbi:MAG: hypothetical protein PHI53_01540 [Candidatus Pacebacteria bacterium]|nr:hypothetical protein [Candidatus Paceibacterota bacterium]
MKKIIAIATMFAVAVMMSGPQTAQAVTAEELQAQINSLLATLSTLQNQLAALQGGSPVSGTVPAACVGVTFTRNLTVGSSGNDVKCLQAIFNTASDTQVAASGPGSLGNETTYFGPLTKTAAVKYQEKYASDILTPVGLTAGTGYVGPSTRTKLNAVLTSGTPTTPTTPTEPTTPTTPSAAGLTVVLASDTPAAGTIATGANGNFTKFTLTAGPEADVSISRIYVTRSGLSADSDLQNIKIVDVETGVYKGSIGSLNVDSRAMITFVPSLVITKGTSKSYYIRAGVISTATAGKTAAFGISAASDITSNASAVTGSFPVVGNAMSVVSLTIGSLTVYEDGTVADSAPDVGDTDVIVNQFKATAGSTENVTIESITVKRTGSAAITDVNNIELYDVTNGVSLGTVASWDTFDKASWSNLNLQVAKGKTIRFKVMVDIINGAGSSKTVNADLIDGTDVLITVKGNTYGFYITPTNGTASWTNGDNGKGASDQTIQNGSLNISKSSATPATGNISAGSDVTLAVFDFEAKGEEAKITQVKVTIVSSYLTNNDVTRISLYDENGTIVAGPMDPTAASSPYSTLTDTFIVPVGTHKYTVKANIADSADTGNSLYARITTGDVTATGMISNNTITVTPASSNVNGNTLTIAGASLVATTLPTPASRSIPKGTNDFVFATFSLDASSAGEGIQVTSITITESLGGSAANADIDNAEIWADLTSANSSRGDIYETKISSTYQWAASTATQAFTISPTLTIPAGTFRKIALVADLNSGGGIGNHTFKITTDGVTANGDSTGSTATVTYTTDAMQTISAVANGTLTVSIDASTPISDIVIGSKTGVTLGAFRLAANNVENLDVDQILVHVTGGNYLSTVYFYDGSTLLDSAPGGPSITWVLADGTLTIPADGNKILTVKADTQAVDGSLVSNNGSIKVGLEGSSNVQATGLASGQSITSDDNAMGNTMYIYKTRPYVTLNSTSPSSGVLPYASALAKFDIRAESTENVTFKDSDGNSLRVEISAYMADTTTQQMAFTLKDDANNVLDTAYAAASNSTNLMSTYVTFDFSEYAAGLSVPAGGTKTISISCDTSTDFNSDGDFLQLWLDDGNSGNNIDWGIDGVTSSNSFNLGNIILRGDVIAGLFTNPS